MTLGRVSCASVGMAIAFGCATTAPPPPANPDASIIGIAVEIDYPVLAKRRASEVHFVRLDDPAASGQIIASNFFSDGYTYLLNAPPGRYAVVAARFITTSSGPLTTETIEWKGGYKETTTRPGQTTSTSTTVYAPRSFFEESASTVGASEVGFMGEVVLDARGDWDDADDTQQLHRDLLTPGHRERNVVLRFLSSAGHVPSAGYELDRGDAARERFLDQTRSRLAGTGWENRLLHPVGAASSNE